MDDVFREVSFDKISAPERNKVLAQETVSQVQLEGNREGIRDLVCPAEPEEGKLPFRETVGDEAAECYDVDGGHEFVWLLPVGSLLEKLLVESFCRVPAGPGRGEDGEMVSYG